MQASNLYPVIFTRMSVREYDPAPLSDAVLSGIRASLGEVPPLHPDAKTAVELLGPTQVHRAIKSPHFAAGYAADDKLSSLQAGYLLEYLNLYLAAMDLGACFNGIAKPHADNKAFEGMNYVMTLAFGTPATPQRRTGPSAFKRKEMQEVCAQSIPAPITEALRLAPSGMNTQPWFFADSGGNIEVFYRPRGMSAKLMTRSLRYIDMGIALANLRIAAEKQGMRCTFDFENPAQQARGDEWICRAVLA